jgi:competence protein ComEC
MLPWRILSVSEREGVLRPALPWLLFALAALWLGFYCAERLNWAGDGPALHILLLLFLVLLGAGGCCLLAARRLSPRKSWARSLLLQVGLSFIAFGLAITTGSQYWAHLEQRSEALRLASGSISHEYLLELTSDPARGSISSYSSANLLLPNGSRMPIRIFWDTEDDTLRPGLACRVSASMRPLGEKQEFLYQRGQGASLFVERVLERRYPQTLIGLISSFRENNREKIAAIGGDGSALLRGVLLGDTSELYDTEAGRAFKVTGLAHLIAVSGSHLVVIATLLSWLLVRLRLSKIPQIAIVVCVLGAYVVLTGLQPSAIRACLMTCAANFSWFIGRRNHAPSALAATAAVMLLFHPPNTFSVGFWLSVFAVFGLTLFCSLLSAWVQAPFTTDGSRRRSPRAHSVGRHLAKGLRQWLLEPFAVTLTAQGATMPLSAPLFAAIPLISPLANILVAPPIVLMVGVGMVMLWIGPLIGPLAEGVLRALCLVGEGACFLAKSLASLPYASIPCSVELLPSILASLVVAALIYILWPQPTRPRACILAASPLLAIPLAALIFALPAAPRVVVMDIGQGDAILVQNESGTVLIDTGEHEDELLRALARNHVSHIDAVILTHLDSDHSGALAALQAGIPVGEVYVAQGLMSAQEDSSAIQAATSLLGRPPAELSLASHIRVGKGMRLDVLWPQTPVFKGGNEESLCFSLVYDSDGDGRAEGTMLLTGDAESEELDRIIQNAPEAHGLRFQVLKVGHHGSRGALSAAQLEEMSIEAAIISVGADNRYGHPNEEVLSILQDAGVEIFRTDLNGDVSLLFRSTGVRILCDTMDG